MRDLPVRAMRKRRRPEHAIDQLYEAIVRPEIWPDALHALARSMDAVGTILCQPYDVGLTDAGLRLPASHDLRDPLSLFVSEGWSQNDHRSDRTRPLAEAGRHVVLEHDITSDDDRTSLCVYPEYYYRYDLPSWAVVTVEIDHSIWAAPFLRARSQGPFTPSDAKRLSTLVPHLTRVIRLARKFSVVSARTSVDVLNALGDGALVVDRRAKVVYLNSRAETIVSRGSGLCVKHGRLVANDSSTQSRLDQLIACATSGRVALERTLLQPVVVKDSSARRLLIEALPGTSSNILGDGHAVLVATDSEDAPILNAAHLRALWGLSEAEARLAVVLGSGNSLAQAADSLHVTYETARSQLKAIFVKTNTHRQTELLRLLVQLARARAT